MEPAYRRERSRLHAGYFQGEARRYTTSISAGIKGRKGAGGYLKANADAAM